MWPPSGSPARSAGSTFTPAPARADRGWSAAASRARRRRRARRRPSVDGEADAVERHRVADRGARAVSGARTRAARRPRPVEASTRPSSRTIPVNTRANVAGGRLGTCRLGPIAHDVRVTIRSRARGPDRVRARGRSRQRGRRRRPALERPSADGDRRVEVPDAARARAPTSVGATKSSSLSTSPARRKAPASVGPPSSSSDCTPSAASRRSSSSSGPGAARAPTRPAAARGRRRGGAAGASALDAAGLELGVVGAHRAHADRDGVGARPAARGRAGGSPRRRPSATPRHGHPPVEGDGRLVRDERPRRARPRCARPRSGRARAISSSPLGELDLDARRAQPLEPRPSVSRVRVAGGGHDARDPGRDDRVRARRRAPVVRARLERDVERRAARALAGRLERDDLGVRAALALVPALADDLAVAARRRRRRPGSGASCRGPARRARARARGSSRSASGSRRAARYARRGCRPSPKIALPATISVGARLAHGAHVLLVDAAVDLDERRRPARSSRSARDALERLGHELLARVAGMDAHAEHEVGVRASAATASSTAVSGLNATPDAEPELARERDARPGRPRTPRRGT